MTVDSGQRFIVPAKGHPLQVQDHSAMLGLEIVAAPKADV